MPDRYALTVQLNPYGVGHAAVTLTDPSGQTYAGFGPRKHNMPIWPGKLDVHTVPTGTTSLPSDFSNVLGDDHRTYTVPITAEQARAAHAEIDRIGREGRWYNALKLDPRVCTTIVDRIMRAAGVNAGLYVLSGINDEYLSDIADTLAHDPKAKVMRQHPLPIPDTLRDLQRDYAYIGGGYDTPSERVQRLPSGQGRDDAAWQDQETPFAERSGRWTASPAGSAPVRDMLKENAPGVPDAARRGDIHRLTRQSAPNATDAFTTGTPPVPYLPRAAGPTSLGGLDGPAPLQPPVRSRVPARSAPTADLPAPSFGAPRASSAGSGGAGSLGNGNGVGDWKNRVAPDADRTIPLFEDRWNALRQGGQPALPGYGLPSVPQLMFDPGALRAPPQSLRVSPGSASTVPPEQVRRLARANTSNSGNALALGNQPASVADGVFANEPSYSIPPPIWGFESRSDSRDEAEDWFARWIQPFLRQEQVGRK